MKHSINLLSCRSMEMNTDLLPVFRELNKKTSQQVHTFIRDIEKSANHRAITPNMLGHKGNNSYICNDLAMRKYLPALSAEDKQILLVTMNNYYFQLAMREAPVEKGERKEKLEKFSHIFVPNQMVYDLMITHFQIRKDQKIQLLQNPFIWNLNQKELAEKYYLDFTLRFARAAKKKILFIMLPNQISEDSRDRINQFQMDRLLEKMGKDWIIITNSLPILEQTKELSPSLFQQVLYIKKQYALENILYFCDILVTDLSFYAAAQAGRGKPFYCMKHNGNAFEQYIEKNHPEMFIASPNDLLNIPYDRPALSEAHKNFYPVFSYCSKENPADYISNLIIS